MKKLIILLSLIFLSTSNLYTSDIEKKIEEINSSNYLHNLSIYGAGEKISDTNYSGLGIKYDSDYGEFVLEKGDDYKRASSVQRVDIDNYLYTKLGLGYLSIEEIISGKIKDVTQTTFGIALGYGNNDLYNFEIGSISNKLSSAGLANTTTKIWYVEGLYKYSLGRFGKVDGVLSFQTAKAYEKRLNDYSTSLSYYPIEDLKFTAKYDSNKHDNNSYRLSAGLNYKFHLTSFFKGEFSPTFMASRNISENVLLSTEYKIGIANRTLKMRDKFEDEINTAQIIAKQINPKGFEKRTTAKPIAIFKSFTMNEDSEYNGKLTASDVDSQKLVYAKVSNPKNGTLSIDSNGNFKYIPNADYNGKDSFKYSVSDGIHTITQTLDITIIDVIEPDSIPNNFSFVDQTSVALNSEIISNEIIVSGINTVSSISITGGTYSINGGTYVSSSGNVNNADRVTVRHTSSSSLATAVNTTLTIGGVSDTFTSTTIAADTSPNAFSFTEQSSVSLNSTIISNTITISGINTSTAISILGGSYSVNGGSYTSSSGTVNDGDTVAVRHTSSSSFATAVNTTLTIGEVSDTFNSTTLAADISPNAFSFVDQASVSLNSEITSNEIVVNGINTSANISITNGRYSINGGSYVSSSGNVNNGDRVTVRHTSSSSHGNSIDTTLTIGGVSDTFTSTTITADTSPNAFSFTDQNSVALNSEITSNEIIVSGINTLSSISITGGKYSINGGSFVSSNGSVNNGDRVTVRHTSSSSLATAVNTTLTIGGVSDIFTSTTQSSISSPTISMSSPLAVFSDGPNIVGTPTVGDVQVNAVYSFVSNPYGSKLTINSNTGEMTWFGSASGFPRETIVIKVTNPDGGHASTSFDLIVI